MLNCAVLVAQLFFLLTPSKGIAQPVTQFRAEVDQTQITLEETVGLKLIVKSEESVGAPAFHAPDFQVVNELNSTSVQYDSIHGMERRQEITEILQPLKTGLLKITQIRLQVGNQVLTAPDIQLTVLPASGHGGHAFQSGSAGIPAQPPLSARDKGQSPVFLRAEVDRKQVYKGEQVIVSYYLYHAAKVFNLQVDQFPVLSGFLREDLDLPIMGPRLESESTSLQGGAYQRALLARYAAYPLQEGALSLDSMSLTLNYEARSARRIVEDEEDLFLSFFQQMAPTKRMRLTSDHVDLQVLPLPEEGKPSFFSGGIGQFQVSIHASQSEVHENEAVSFILKVTGRGNISSIQEPHIQWPAGLELYESKGRVQTGKGGEREQAFEFLVIPRASGVLELPAIELNFFDPVQKRYYSRSTQPMTFNVLPAVRPRVKGEESVVPPSPTQKGALPAVLPTEEVWHGLKPLDAKELGEPRFAIWRLLYFACIICFTYLVLNVSLSFLKTKRARKTRSTHQLWNELRSLGRKAAQGQLTDPQVTEAYEKLNELIFAVLQKKWGIEVRFVSRAELREHFMTHVHSPQAGALWKKLENIFLFSERVRFAGGSSDAEAHAQLTHWISEAESFLKTLH